jgi:hypothetical protein
MRDPWSIYADEKPSEDKPDGKSKNYEKFGDTGDGFLPVADEEKKEVERLKEAAEKGQEEIDALTKKLDNEDEENEEDDDPQTKEASVGYDYDRRR